MRGDLEATVEFMGKYLKIHQIRSAPLRYAIQKAYNSRTRRAIFRDDGDGGGGGGDSGGDSGSGDSGGGDSGDASNSGSDASYYHSAGLDYNSETGEYSYWSGDWSGDDWSDS